MRVHSLQNVVTLASVIAGLFLSGCVIVVNGSGQSIEYGNCIAKAKVEITIALNEPMEPNMTFKAANNDAAVQVTGAETDQAAVEVTLIAQAPDEEQARELLEKTRVELVRSGDTLTFQCIKPTLPPCHSLDWAYTARLPRSASLNLTSDDAQIDVSDIDGTVQISNNDGGMNLDRIGNPQASHRLQTDDGTIKIAAVKGRLEIVADDGPITAEDITGDVKVAVNDARVTLRRIGGGLTVQTDDGPITAEDPTRDITVRADDAPVSLLSVRSNVTVQTGDGPLKVRYTPDAPPAPRIKLTTDDGKIELFTPDHFSAAVDIQTDRGPINTELPISVVGQIKPNRLQGRIAAGEGTLTIRADDAPITIKPAQPEPEPKPEQDQE